jgi:hypothetical protein
MIKIYAKHLPYFETGHLGEVVAEMRKLGRPTIRVVEYDGDFFAVEGSHRLAAAHYLKLTPKLYVLKQDSGSNSHMFWANVKEELPVYEF